MFFLFSVCCILSLPVTVQGPIHYNIGIFFRSAFRIFSNPFPRRLLPGHFPFADPPCIRIPFSSQSLCSMHGSSPLLCRSRPFPAFFSLFQKYSVYLCFIFTNNIGIFLFFFCINFLIIHIFFFILYIIVSFLPDIPGDPVPYCGLVQLTLHNMRCIIQSSSI